MESNSSISKESASANSLYIFCKKFNENNQRELPTKYKKKNAEKKVKNGLGLVKSDCPIEGIEVIDIRIKSKWDEDELYLTDDEIFKQIRRGNSIIHTKNTEDYTFARMGLPKFFDYSKKYDTNNLHYQHLRNRVIKPIEEAKGPYAVYLTEKANGENFQVSYNSKYDAWAVGSKNVCILFKTEADIDWYINSPYITLLAENQAKNKNKKKQKKDDDDDNQEGHGESQTAARFTFCIRFARLWMNIVNNKIGSLLPQFKAEMADYTFIGENVGNQVYQHIKQYKELNAIFYAIVNNNESNNEICLPLQTAFDIFKKFNLSYVPIEHSQPFNTLTELIQYLNIKYDETLLKTVNDGGEGSVAYFVSLEGNKERVLGLAKLKTFEYRYLRKIREKIKKLHCKNSNAKVENLKSLFVKESKDIIEGLESKLDFEKYMKFGKYMLDYANRDSVDYSNVFSDFIVVMQELFEKGKDVNEIDKDEIKKKLLPLPTIEACKDI